MSLAISKKIILLTIVSFCSIFSFAQNTTNVVYNETVIKLKDNSLVYPEEILFKTDSDVYFIYGDDKYYKIPLTSIDGDIDCKVLNSTKFGSFLLKYVKQSQTGITLSILGSTGSVILPFVVNNVAILVVPPVISLTGFVIWASSYSHLKKYAIIDSAIEYK
jgi:hypothetical protein